MHDLEFNHMHMAAGEELNEVAWAADNVELTTVGIDIGSSTSHLMFAQVHLQRLGTALSSRFVVVNRRIIFFSRTLQGGPGFRRFIRSLSFLLCGFCGRRSALSGHRCERDHSFVYFHFLFGLEHGCAAYLHGLDQCNLIAFEPDER